MFCHQKMWTLDALEGIGKEAVLAFFKVNAILTCILPPEYNHKALPMYKIISGDFGLCVRNVCKTADHF